jgi:Protein of unknown function (DUF541)
MRPSRRIPFRVTAALAGVVAVIALGGYAVANAQTTTGSDVATSAPGWCCIDGTAHGITVTGTADVHGRGDAARDDAIARAVADANDQAKAAADAAGITLGAVVDMQVSAPQYPYAVPMAESSSGGAAGDSSGAPGVACPQSACSGGVMQPMPFVLNVTVTITWAIA